MSTCPRIVVYESADAPPAHRFLSCFYTPAGKALPMVFNAPDREAAISAASGWWANEQARLAKRTANAAARSARMRRLARIGAETEARRAALDEMVKLQQEIGDD